MTEVVETGRPTRQDHPPAPVPSAAAANWRPAATDTALVRVVAEARLLGARGRYEDFLPDAEAISQRRHSPYATGLILTLSVMVVAIVAWMHFSRVDEVVTAPGIVRMASSATAAGDTSRLEIETRISSNDIGVIAPGQDAITKVQAYDWTRHGTLKGKVVDITAAAALAPASDARGGFAAQPYFVVRIALDKDFLGDNPRRNRLIPGMTATIDLHVGERSILSFFTAGLLRTVSTSLRERN